MRSLVTRCVLDSSFFSNGYQPFFFLFILFISLISSHSLTLQLLSLFFFLCKSFYPLSYSLTIWLLSSFLFSTSLSNSLISFNGSQVPKKFLRPLYWHSPSHPLEWSGKAIGGPSFDLQITTIHFGGCKDWISKFFKLSSLFKFSFDMLF